MGALEKLRLSTKEDLHRVICHECHHKFFAALEKPSAANPKPMTVVRCPVCNAICPEYNYKEETI